MALVLPEIVISTLITRGINNLKNNKEAFKDIFAQLDSPDLTNDFGDDFIEELWAWFSETNVPVLTAWSFNADRIPCYSVRLGSEVEDESKASMQDFFGAGTDADTITGVMQTSVDIGIHAAKSGDHVLWLYYILFYILFQEKRQFERFYMHNHTFSASDYNRDNQYMGNNIWSRWIRLKLTTQNFMDTEKYKQYDDMDFSVAVDSKTPDQVEYPYGQLDLNEDG